MDADQLNARIRKLKRMPAEPRWAIRRKILPYTVRIGPESNWPQWAQDAMRRVRQQERRR